MDDPVRVAVVALDPVLEAGATAVLAGCPQVVVVPPAERPQVCVLLVDTVDEQVLDLIRGSRAAAPHPEVVLVAGHPNSADAATVLAAGACGLLRRADATVDRLNRTVLAAAGGDCVVSSAFFVGLLDSRARGAAALPAGVPPLSGREQAVLRLVADGRETDEIAQELCWSSRTVVGVVHDITHRFNLRNRAHAVAYALRAGML